MKPETKFKIKVISDLRDLQSTWFVKVQQVAIRGIPDFLLCVNGRFVAMELKATAEEDPNPLQQWTLHSISSKGGLSFVVHPGNWENTFMLIKELDDGIDNIDYSVNERPLTNNDH